MSEINVVFPIAVLSSDGLEFVRTLSDFSQCSRKAFTSGYYQKVEIVDVNLRSFTVENTSLSKSSFSASLIDMIKGIANVKIEFKNIKTLNLSNFKEILIRSFTEETDFWDNDGLLEERIDFVRSTNTGKEIIEKLTSWYSGS